MISVEFPEALSDSGEAHPDRSHVPGELLLADRREAQQARGRGQSQQGAAPDAHTDKQKRQREGPHRVQRQQHENKHSRQAGGRPRENSLSQVHEIHDDAGGEFHDSQEEAYTGALKSIRYLYFYLLRING